MPVIILSKYRYRGYATPQGLNVETVVVEVGQQTNEYVVEGYIDLSNMEDGDTVVVREYLGTGHGTERIFISNTYANRQNEPIVRFYTKTIDRESRYRVTITQTSGSVRTFPYTFIVELMGEI